MNWEKAHKPTRYKKVSKADKPATEAQLRLLSILAEQTGRTYPKDLTVGEASDWIGSMKRSKRNARGTFGRDQ